MGRISRTFELAGASWRVLKSDKELIALPLVSLLATIAVAVSFLIPIFDACTSTTTGTASCELASTDYILLGVMYVVLAFITIFFNAALVYAANQRMSGGDPTVGSALRGAALRVHRIFPWALVSATVSVILRAVEERMGLLGRIVAGIVGVAWSLVTFLVIPVLVIEDVGVGEALKRSGAMFKRTWGREHGRAGRVRPPRLPPRATGDRRDRTRIRHGWGDRGDPRCDRCDVDPARVAGARRTQRDLPDGAVPLRRRNAHRGVSHGDIGIGIRPKARTR